MEEEKTVTISKLTLWKSAVVILAVLLIASLFTGGFGINKSTGATVQQQNTGKTQQQAVTDLSVFTNNPSLYPAVGPSNAKNTVIEFADFQCPYCAMASGLPNWTTQYASQYGDLVGVAKNAETAGERGQLKFIFVTMNFLDRGATGESTWAGEAALCANDQGQFWAMHDSIYAASTGPSEDTGKYTKANLEIIASKISGLDQTKFKTCLESDKYLSQVQQSNNAAGNAGIQGTPTFYVNGKSVQPSWSAIQAALQ